MSRRFPPPWDIEEANASCFIVKAAPTGQVSVSQFIAETGEVLVPSCAAQRTYPLLVSRLFYRRHPGIVTNCE